MSPYIKADVLEQSKYVGYFIPYGGEILGNYDCSTLNIKKIWEWVIHLSDGLHILHHNGIVHMDIKSTNVVIHQGLPKLIDFGLSHFADDYTENDLMGYYVVYPLFYNVWQVGDHDHDQRVIDNLYKDYEDLAKIHVKSYVKGTRTDPIFGYIEDSDILESDYFDEVILPNLLKIDVFSLYSMIYNYFIVYIGNRLGKENPTLYSYLKDLTMYCTHTDCEQQYDIDQVIKYIDTLNIRKLIAQ